MLNFINYCKYIYDKINKQYTYGQSADKRLILAFRK